jgi:hypothetical protein
MSAQVGAGDPASMVTVVPPAMITLSVGPGTIPQLQVEGLFHAPDATDVHVGNPDSNFESLFFSPKYSDRE